MPLRFDHIQHRWHGRFGRFLCAATLAEVEAVAVACTVPAILVEIRAMIERYYADAHVAIVGGHVLGSEGDYVLANYISH